MHVHCLRKKETKMFLVISSIKLWRFWWNLVHSFLNKLAAKSINVFHFTWITSLHYLVKPEMFIAYVLPLSCYRKKLQNLSHLNCGLHIRQICTQLITACAIYYKRRSKKHSYLTWSQERRHWRMAAAMTTRPSFAHRSQSLFQFVQISDAYFVHLLLQ